MRLTMFCSDCGEESDPGDRFCAGCGAELVPAEDSGGPSADRHDDPLWRYRMGHELGAGGSGVVHFAYQADLDRPVAIKALAPELLAQAGFLSRFRAEAVVMARLSDPHCVSVYEFIEAPQGAWVVMEYVPGASLRAVLVHAPTNLSPEQCMGVIKGALQGLAHAHDLGLVHRDIKPENILVDPEGNSKLADFGLTGEDPTATSPLAGTPAYMSPEQVRGERIDHRSDLYSTGVVLYEMLIGARPYLANSPAEVVAMHALAPLPSVKSLPAPVGAMVHKALAKQPGDRQQSATQLLGELEEAAASSYGPDWATRAGVAALIGSLGGVGGVVSAAAATGGSTTAAATTAGASQGAAATTGASSGSVAAPAQVAAGSGAPKGLWAKLGATKLGGVTGSHPVAATALAAVVAAGAVVGGLAATNAGKSTPPLPPSSPPPIAIVHGGQGVVSEQGTVGGLRFGTSTQADVQAFAGAPDTTEDQVSLVGAGTGYASAKVLGYQCSSSASRSEKQVGSLWCQTTYYLNVNTATLVGFDTESPSFHTARGTTVGMPSAQAQQLEGEQLMPGCFSGIWVGGQLPAAPSSGTAARPAAVLIGVANGGGDTVLELESESNTGAVGLLFC